MNNQEWERAAAELKPLLEQISVIAKKHEFGEDILSIGLNGTGYVSICLINDYVHYSLIRMDEADHFKIPIRYGNRQEGNP